MKKFLTVLALSLLIFSSAATYALNLDSVEGSWSNVNGGYGAQTLTGPNPGYVNGVDIEKQVLWGIGVDYG